MSPRSNLAALVAALSLFVAAPAYAEDSSVDGYGGPGGNIQDTIGGQGEAKERNGGQAPAGAPGGGEAVPVNEVTAADNPEEGGGSLPFTGLDLGFLAAAGALLLALGIAMRRLTRTDGAA